MHKILFLSAAVLTITMISNPAFAGRDWEYWSRYSFDAPITKEISYQIKPEWRMREDMSFRYLFKLEQAINFKIGKYLEIAPYYVWQENKTAKGDDRSDLFYLDVTGKLPLEKIFDIKIIDRFRYQYNFDKATTVLRNSARITKAFKLGEFEWSPFIEDEIFYDVKSERFNENWASVGISFALNKYLSISASYLLDTRKRGSDWKSANVLVTSAILKF